MNYVTHAAVLKSSVDAVINNRSQHTKYAALEESIRTLDDGMVLPITFSSKKDAAKVLSALRMYAKSIGFRLNQRFVYGTLICHVRFVENKVRG